jgi:hypothetical protein
VSARLGCSVGGMVLLLGCRWLLGQGDPSGALRPVKEADNSTILRNDTSGGTWTQFRRDGFAVWSPLPRLQKSGTATSRVIDNAPHGRAMSSPRAVLLRKVLEQDGYSRVKLDRLKCGYLAVKTVVNGKSLYLAIDTGAPNTTLDPKRAEHLALPWQFYKFTDRPDDPAQEWSRFSHIDSIEFGAFRHGKLRVGGHDMSEINRRLEYYMDPQLDGVIGADLLETGLAILDYKTYDLYLLATPGGDTKHR